MNARAVLLTTAGALVVFMLVALVDRHFVQPRKEAARMVDAARPLASSTNEAEWLAAESLLAKAELLQHGRPDIAELRALIAQRRVSARADDEKILRQAIDGCLGIIEKGHPTDAAAIRAELGKVPARDLHVRCMRVQLSDIAHAPPQPVPSIVASAVASAIASSSAKPCPPNQPLCP